MKHDIDNPRAAVVESLRRTRETAFKANTPESKTNCAGNEKQNSWLAD
jgi:hypothetical protein